MATLVVHVIVAEVVEGDAATEEIVNVEVDGLMVTDAVANLVVSALLVAFTLTVCVDVTEEGALYSPYRLMLPVAGDIDQVTPVVDVPVTEAENCCEPPAVSVAVDGETVTTMPEGGLMVIAALADFVVSALLVAVTVTVWVDATDDGAVYKPDDEMDPVAGEIDQVTAVFEVPVTVAENCCVPPGVSVAAVGEIVTPTVGGATEIVKLSVTELADADT